MPSEETIELVEDKELSKDDVIDLLADDSDESKIDEPKKDKSKEKEEDDEDIKKESKKESKKEVEEEDESEEKNEDEDEEEEPKFEVPHYSRKEILKLFPDLYKKLPFLEKSYYRERAFTEVFPTPDDAKEAATKASTLDKFSADLVKGNTVPVLQAIKNTSPEAFNKAIDNYLPTLYGIDKDAYYHVIGGVIKDAVSSMIQEAKSSNDEDLHNTAKSLYKFVFGNTKWEPHKKLSSDKPETDDSVKKEREALAKERYDSARSDLTERTNNVLKATVDANIDPKGSMTDYVKKSAIREVMELLEDQLNSDREFQSQKDRLWGRVFDSNFSKDSLDKVRSAYLSKAKTLLPSIIKKARVEALSGMGKKVVEKKPERIPVGRVASSPKKEANEIPKGMKSIDYLMQED